MSSRLSGSSMERRPLQLLNALKPRLFRFFGSLISSMPSQEENACDPMAVTVSGI